MDGAAQSIGPVLLVGVGHTATRILQRLKHNVNSRIGNLSEMPAIKIVCLDTERFTSGNADRPEESNPLDACEQVLLPLRRSEEYRNRKDSHKKWLNRRWIYNVPKTLQTEGLRPLGRLAFVDNFAELCEGLENAIGKISCKEALVATAEKMGVEPNPDRPRVFILSSISGGLGSGMTLDLAYTIRLILDEHSLNSDCIHGLFMHSTSNQHGDVGISVANTFAFLTELRHITQHGFPGEESCGITPIDDDAPVDFPYFLHLGDNADSNTWNRSLDAISEYLYLNIFSPSASFFDNCRKLENEIEHFALRSFGVESVGTGENSCQRLLAGFFKESLLKRWMEVDGHIAAPNSVAALETNTAPKALAGFVRGITSKFIPKTGSAPLADKLARWAIDRSIPENNGRELLEELDSLIGEPLKDGKSPLSEMNEDLADELAIHGKLLCQQVERAVMDCFRHDRLSFLFALAMIQRMTEFVEQNRSSTSAEIAALNDDNADMLAVLKALRKRTKDANDDKSQAETAARRLHENRHAAIEKRAVCELLLYVVRRLNSLKSDVGRMKEDVSVSIQTGVAELNQRALLKQFNGLQQKLAASLLGELENILDNIERRIYVELVQPAGDFWSLLQNASFARRYLPDAVGQAVRSELAASGRKIDIDSAFGEYLASAKGSAGEEISRMVTQSMPMLAGCGGPTRMMVGIPQHVQSTRVPEEIFSQTGVVGQVVAATTGDLVIATETEDVSLAEIAFKMLETRSDCVELARRLSSRSDVQWKSLEDLM